MLFKSFNQIKLEVKPLEDILDNYQNYHAHTTGKRPYETLCEHTNDVISYALKLIKKHGLDNVVDSLLDEIAHHNQEVNQHKLIGSYLKKLFFHAIVFHDFGKVNENFQTEKMSNTTHFKPNENNLIGSTHSLLSAYIFLNVHILEILQLGEFTEEEETLLIGSAFLFANPILKHHSRYLDFKLDHFTEDKFMTLQPYLELLKIDFVEDFKEVFKEAEDYVKEFTNIYSKDNQIYFPFYALIKLNFSLLTASDYYATNDFMSNMPVKEFGLITEDFKKQLFKNFISNKDADYNRKLYEEFKDRKSVV